MIFFSPFCLCRLAPFALLLFVVTSCTSPLLTVTSEGAPRQILARAPNQAANELPRYRLAPQDEVQIRIMRAGGGPEAVVTPGEVLKLHFSFGKGNYHIMPGDQLSITFSNDPGEEQEVVVRPDGKITFPELGEAQASGLTPLRFAQKVNRLYEGKLNTPAATVSVDQANTASIKALNGEYQVRGDGQLSIPLLGEFQAVGVPYKTLNSQLTSRARRHFLNPVSVELSTPVSTQRQSREELNDQLFGYDAAQHVSSEGTVILPQLGAVQARGKTLAELKNAVQDKAARYLGTQAYAAVTLIASEQRQFFISGQVQRPGQYPLGDQMTIAKAVARAGGLKDEANQKEIRLIHRTKEGRLLVYRTNLSRIREGGHALYDLALSPQDVLYVPRSKAAEANLFVSQYITKMLPFSTGVSYNYSETPTRNFSP